MGLGEIPCTLLNDRLVLGTVLEDLLLDRMQFFDTDQQLAFHGPDLWLERVDQALDIRCGDAFFLVKDKPALCCFRQFINSVVIAVSKPGMLMIL